MEAPWKTKRRNRSNKTDYYGKVSNRRISVTKGVILSIAVNGKVHLSSLVLAVHLVNLLG